MQDQLETRFFTTRFDPTTRRVSGYAAVFYDGTPDTEYELAPGVFERINPHAFDESLKRANVKLYRMHERKAGLARQPKTLRLAKDSRGLTYDAEILDTTAGRDALAELSAGYLTGASVGMRFGPEDVRLRREGNRQIAEVMRAELVEISLVDDPAYKATTAILRYVQQTEQESLEALEKSVRDLLHRCDEYLRTSK